MSRPALAATGGTSAKPDHDSAEWELRCELAAVYRLVAHYRMTDLVFTHISARLPGPDHHFLINPYGLMFEEITASNLVVVGLDGHTVRPTQYAVNPAGFVIHSAIHASRMDAACVLHTHSRAGCAVAAQQAGLLPLNQISMEFYNRVGYHDYEGIALNRAEQQRLTADLGRHPSMILRNHGLLTVGSTPAEAFLRMFYLERACQIQLDAMSGGAQLSVPSPEVCERTAAQFEGTADDDYQDDQSLQLAWSALLRLVGRIAPDYSD
ncbi:class II aldolase/adducin family protein [Amycolatopsis ultiminotia]|uniref:Class II aldolase/adducin family protein n=1 Tax=Amycolatopsis ultiminotia TaxID=543629 RepID=A0ABP6WJV9_9PSEU